MKQGRKMLILHSADFYFAFENNKNIALKALLLEKISF